MRFLFVFLIILQLLGCQGMVPDIVSNSQNTSKEATVKNNTNGIKWHSPVRDPNDRHSALTTIPGVLVPSTELEAKENATILQPLDRPQDTLKGGNKNASLSKVTTIRTPNDYPFIRNPPKYFYEVLGFVIVLSACVYGVVLFLRMVRYLESEEARARQNQAQQLPEPEPAPQSFQDLVKRDDHRRCSLIR